MTGPLTLLSPDDHSVLVQPMFNGRVLGSVTAFLVEGSNGKGFQLVTEWHVLVGRNAVTDEIHDKEGGATPDVLHAH